MIITNDLKSWSMVIIKKLFLFLALFLLTTSVLKSQWYTRYYETKSLSELNHRELSLLYEKSNNVKKTGKILTIAGLSTASLSAAILVIGDADISEEFYSFCRGMIIAGSAVMIIGIPIWITGYIRNREVNKMLNFRISDTSLQVSSSLLHSNGSKACSPVLTLSFRF